MVSVIIPFHNRFKVINDTIRSVYQQSYLNYELILVDDSSEIIFSETAQCQEWQKKFSRKNINFSVIRNSKNLGSGLSRQRGLNKAKGIYVAFLDSDDCWSEDFLEKSVEVHEKSPQIAATYCTCFYTDGKLRSKTDLDFREICSTLIRHYRVWQTGALLWKKKYTSKWKNLKSNQDSLFEFDSGLINDYIKHVDGPILKINKDTGYHTHHRVKKAQNYLNICVIYSYYLKHLSKINSQVFSTFFLAIVCHLKLSKLLYLIISRQLLFPNDYYRAVCKDNYLHPKVRVFNFIHHKSPVLVPLLKLILSLEKFILLRIHNFLYKAFYQK